MRESIRLAVLSLVVISVLACGRAGAAEKADESGAPRSPAAVAAMKKYDRAVAKAREAYQAATAAAGRDLKNEMDAALKAAMRAQNLDETKRIEATVKRAEAAFVVKTVLYGLPGNWMDLTEDLKRVGWVSDGKVELPQDLALTLGKDKDPAPGRPKQLQILLWVNGQEVRIWSNDLTRTQIQAGGGK